MSSTVLFQIFSHDLLNKLEMYGFDSKHIYCPSRRE